MAADLWQLVNGWELVDWSLNVGGDTPTEAPSPSLGGAWASSYPAASPFLIDEELEALAASLLLLT